jgi:glycine hydroxymethyltransferase
VAATLHPDPFPHGDVVTATTHKTMRGPRGGIILCRQEHADRIDAQVFPGMQGGPLMHVIAGKAIALKEAMAPDFRIYQEQILKNARALAVGMAKRGYRLVSGGTDNHMVLVDLTSQGLSGRRATETLEKVGITVNKNLIPYDTRSAKEASGIRLGSPALTSRGMRESEMEQITDLIHQALSAPDDDARLSLVQAAVLEITESFPLYQRSYHM